FCPTAWVFETGRSVTSEHLHLAPGGRSMPVECRAAPIRGPEGRVERVVQILRDISARKRVLEELHETMHGTEQLFRMGDWGVLHLSPNFSFLSQPRVVVLFGLATVIEIAADKIPAVDHTLDVLSTFLRPIAGSILAAAAMGWIRDPLTAIVLGVAVGAPTALVPHGAKAGLRALSSAFTLGLANPVISLIEDVAVVVLFVLAILIPLLVVALIAIVAGLLLWRRLHQRRLQPAA
ncbi:MAG: DUF4126 family protein, partial [Vicinamibacteria bacterium]|nr:DUF4126 family protein [Vicinamibacteria bacterium]